jgi:hypothetical protein
MISLLEGGFGEKEEAVPMKEGTASFFWQL